ncbi:probable fucosyltransferase 7 isoform X1 [Eutrema salsugineum]|nr:probable fucosyltransferase 7 isoform X1 [Eutrema salsugineum]
MNRMMIKLTITVATCFLLSSVLLQPFSNTSNCHQSHVTTTGTKDSETPRDKLVGGLLTADFDEGSCLSRYHQSLLYRKPSPYKPSQYLVSKLRSYEKLHKRCGPGTNAYKEATKNLGHGDDDNNANKSDSDCRYIVWVPVFGLGNRILTLASVFLYALLTERLILVDQHKDISDLFCEPFPGTSWLLPLDFPLADQLGRFDQTYLFCYGTMLKNHAINSTTSERIPSHLYLHLIGGYRDHDKMFFCETDQSVIGKVPWLVVKSNLYFVPSLWLIPSFQTELSKLFPQRDTVFHHLSRYLFHPTNQVWGMVTRSYKAYLSRADETLGIQVRVFGERAIYLQHVMDQILACTQREKLLPEAAPQEEETQVNVSKSAKVKAVLVTSLSSGYSENLKSMYWEYPSSTGDIVVVHQPSQEGHQQTDKKRHDQRALAEMYLLSLTDKLVTSGWSTFGYVAQGLGGLKPWILYKPVNHKVPDPPCGCAMSMEPCFHSPPAYGCKGKTGIKTGNMVPYVRYCEDRSWGLKLVQVPL